VGITCSTRTFFPVQFSQNSVTNGTRTILFLTFNSESRTPSGKVWPIALLFPGAFRWCSACINKLFKCEKVCSVYVRGVYIYIYYIHIIHLDCRLLKTIDVDLIFLEKAPSSIQLFCDPLRILLNYVLICLRGNPLLRIRPRYWKLHRVRRISSIYNIYMLYYI